MALTYLSLRASFGASFPFLIGAVLALILGAGGFARAYVTQYCLRAPGDDHMLALSGCIAVTAALVVLGCLLTYSVRTKYCTRNIAKIKQTYIQNISTYLGGGAPPDRARPAGPAGCFVSILHIC